MKFCLIIFMLIVVSSCQEERKSKMSKEFKLFLPDSPSYIYGPVIYVGDELGLTRLDQGVDSLELRLWIGKTTSPADLFNIKFEKGKWIASIHDLRAEKNSRVSDTGSTWFKSHNYRSEAYIFPEKKNYSKFIDSLIMFDLRNLPPQEEETDEMRFEVSHPTFYTIEIATKNYYKFFTYKSPEHAPNTIPKNLIFTNVLRLISNHFYEDPDYKNWYDKRFQISR